MKVNSYAKINLALDITGERSDGYHNIDTIMNLIDLKDVMDIRENYTGDLKLSCDNPNFPTDQSNIIYKVFKEVKKIRDIEKGFDIAVSKNIPIAAGLAGGSSNGCEFLLAIDEILDLQLSDDEIFEVCKKVGADLYYFTSKKTVRARGIGNELEELSPFGEKNILIVNNSKAVSSKTVYENLKIYGSGIGDLCDMINRKDYGSFYKKTYNIMEGVTFKMLPELKDIKNEILNLGADYALMSGSGPTIFGLFEDDLLFDRAYRQIKDKYEYVFKTKTI